MNLASSRDKTMINDSETWKQDGGRLPGWAGHTLRVVFSLALAGCALDSGVETVGRHGNGRVVLPVNQVITPAGKQIDLPGMRAQGMALSPDGKMLVVSGLTSELLVLDPATGATKQHVKLPKLIKGAPPEASAPEFLDFDGHSQMSFAGLAFSPDGKRLALSNVNGDMKLFEVLDIMNFILMGVRWETMSLIRS